MESIYWVISRDCNQRCPHCYNDSQPGAPGLTLDEASRCVANLPAPDEVPVDRFILSGGEVLVWPELLFHALKLLHERYGHRTSLWVQTNGDLLDERTLQRLLDHSVSRVDVSSMDAFHPKATLNAGPIWSTSSRHSSWFRPSPTRPGLGRASDSGAPPRISGSVRSGRGDGLGRRAYPQRDPSMSSASSGVGPGDS